MTKKRILLIVLAIFVLISGAVLATQLAKPDSQTAENMTENMQKEDTTLNATQPTKTPMQSDSTSTEVNQQRATGRYISYSENALSDQSYNQTILFFHAPWCPQCRAFEKNIQASSIPEGTQILVVDYDTSTDLKKQHGVTLQTTFVSVDTGGNQLKKWVGYSSDHTLATLLEQFKS